MRKLLTWLFVIVILVVAVIVAAPFLLPASFVKDQVQTLAGRALGRELRIDGDLDYTLWPPLTLHAGKVALANREGEGERDMLAFEELDLQVDALAYLDGRVDVAVLRLVQPVAHLSIDENGVANWDFGDGDGDGGPKADGGSGDGGGVALPEIVLGDIRIENGLVTFADRRSGIERSFENIQLTIAGSAGSPAIDIDGSLVQGGENAALKGRIADANALAAGGASDLQLDLTMPGGTASLAGKLDGGKQAFDVRTGVDLTDPRHLASWAGQPLDLPDGVLSVVKLDAGLAGTAGAFDIAPFQLSVDRMSASGDLAVTLGDRAKLSGSLALAALDLGPYLPPEGDAGGPDAAPAATDGSAAAAGWPDDPLDLPLPLPVDLDLVVETAGLDARGIELGAGKYELFADNLHARLKILEQALYGGNLEAEADIAGNDAPSLKASAKLEGIALLPILKSLAGFERLEGTGDVGLSLKSEGASVKALVEALDGDGTIMLRDGAILGFNIGAVVRQVMTLGVSHAAKEERKTDFAELGGTFTIDKGVLRNEDIALRAPLLRVTGAGTVDLPARTLDYRLAPKAASTLQGQDATSDPDLELGVPIVVHGPWSDPQVQLDIDGALTGNLLSGEGVGAIVGGLAAKGGKLGEVGENLEKVLGVDPGKAAAGGLVKELLGGSAPSGEGDGGAASGEDQPAQAVKPAEKALESLGRLLGGN
ncbi:MAG: AsmA family protein [Geminicoccaceae bacterium]|nr:AsmA family protein [Geminicoccaceae bacterium]